MTSSRGPIVQKHRREWPPGTLPRWPAPRQRRAGRGGGGWCPWRGLGMCERGRGGGEASAGPTRYAPKRRRERVEQAAGGTAAGRREQRLRVVAAKGRGLCPAVHIWQSRNPSLLLPLFHRRRCPTGPPAQLHSVTSVRRATDTASPFASKCDLLRFLQENCYRFLEHVSVLQVH